MNNEKESSAAARKQGFQQKGVFARVCRPLRAGPLAASEPQAGSVLQLLHEGSVFGIAGGRRKSACCGRKTTCHDVPRVSSATLRMR